jgi:hypothetical protein
MQIDRAMLARLLKAAGIAVIGLAVVAYAGDFAYFHLRLMHAKDADPVETFTAPRLLAIAEKGNKVAYELDPLNPQQTYVCAHTWFPQGGHQPCWYLKPKSQQPIPM